MTFEETQMIKKTIYEEMSELFLDAGDWQSNLHSEEGANRAYMLHDIANRFLAKAIKCERVLAAQHGGV